MGRPREFDMSAFLKQAAELFIRRGYGATSIDEIVKATGVVRGSLYSLYGSKRGIFAAALEFEAENAKELGNPESGSNPPSDSLLDLINVAVFELAAHDEELADRIQRLITARGISAQQLGERALERAGLNASAA